MLSVKLVCAVTCVAALAGCAKSAGSGNQVGGSNAQTAQAGGTTETASPKALYPQFRDVPSEWRSVPASGGAGSSNASGVQEVTLLGDPSKPGPYVQLLKVAPHMQIAAHHHAGDRVGTVLTGTWHFGYGDKYDQAGLKTLPVGSIYTEPAKQNHFAQTGDEAVVVQITGSGPTNTIYVNPADDAANKKH